MTQSTPPVPPIDYPTSAVSNYGEPVPNRRTSGSAIASLVLGILGCIPLISGLLAIVLGIVGIRKTKDPAVAGRGLAIAGLILGIISVLGWTGLGGMLGVGYVESKPARAVAQQFLQDLSTGNISSATANSVGFTPGTLQTQSALTTPFGPLQSVSFRSFNYSVVNAQTTMILGGTATYANATKTCSFQLIKVGGVYKVRSFSVN